MFAEHQASVQEATIDELVNEQMELASTDLMSALEKSGPLLFSKVLVSLLQAYMLPVARPLCAHPGSIQVGQLFRYDWIAVDLVSRFRRQRTRSLGITRNTCDRVAIGADLRWPQSKDREQEKRGKKGTGTFNSLSRPITVRLPMDGLLCMDHSTIIHTGTLRCRMGPSTPSVTEITEIQSPKFRVVVNELVRLLAQVAHPN